MHKKKQLISEIRDLEQKIKIRPKADVEYSSFGLMEEMNLEQLRLRLHNAKQQRKDEEEKKRQENMGKK